MKKRLSILMALAMLMLLVTGCTGSKESSNESNSTSGNMSESSVSDKDDDSSAEPAGERELTVMMSSGDFGAGLITKALETVAQSNDIKLEFEVIPDDQMLTVTNTKLATGNAGDVLVHNFGLTDVSAKDLAPLEGSWADKITDTTKPLCLDENGNILKAPLGGESNMGFLYNKKVLQDAGVELPLNNYSDLIAACEKIKAAGQTPVYISNQESWTAQILLLCSMTSVFDGNPEPINSITTNKVKPVDVPELAELFQNALSLKELGYINEDYMSATNDMAFEALANGECGFYAQLDSAYGSLSEYYPEEIEDLGMMYVPLWNDKDNGYVLFGTAINYLSVVGTSSNLELANEFVNAMVSDDGLSVYYSLIPGSAPYKNLNVELDANPFNNEMRGYAEKWPSMSEFNNATYDGVPALGDFYGAFSERIQGLFSGISVEDTLNAWYDAYSADARALRLDGF